MENPLGTPDQRQLLARWTRVNTARIGLACSVLALGLILCIIRETVVARALQMPTAQAALDEQRLMQLETTTALERQLIERLKNRSDVFLQALAFHGRLVMSVFIWGVLMFGVGLLVPAVGERRRIAQLQHAMAETNP